MFCTLKPVLENEEKELSEIGKLLLNSIGRIFAADMLIHNVDRFEVKFPYDGGWNAGNLMICQNAILNFDPTVTQNTGQHRGNFLQFFSIFSIQNIHGDNL